jgi:outer membrane receptor protein involved in Fe transport
MPGVSVTVRNEATGLVRSVTTEGNGSYVITQLPPGTYALSVVMDGFANQERTGFQLAAGSQSTVDWTLQLAGVEEALTVTGQAPLVERTRNTLGATLGTREIEEVPTNFRNFVTLSALIPGITATSSSSTFEGGTVEANGSPSNQSVFLVDGTYNNDDRLGSNGPQVRLVLDSISEYQVLGNQYSVEYGGAGGAIINMITRGGTNTFDGRVYGYFRDDKLHSRSPFLPDDEAKPDESTRQAGFSVGGPIVRNKAHFQFAVERDQELANAFVDYPDEALPLARDFGAEFSVVALNIFGRADVQFTDTAFLSVRNIFESAGTDGDGHLEDGSLFDARRFESDFDNLTSVTLTNVLTDRASNVLRVGRTAENLAGSGSPGDYYKPERSYFGWFIGFDGRDQFDLGQANEHPSYTAGPGGPGAYTQNRAYTFDNTFSYFVPTSRGDHTLKVGGGLSSNRMDPRGTVDSGTFVFEEDLPYDPANPATYPFEFTSQVGPCCPDTFNVTYHDLRSYFFVEDRWRASDRLTFNLGLRYDYQRQTSDSKDDFGPRIGAVYDVTGEGTTVLRAGFGRFNTVGVVAQTLDLLQQGLITKFPTVTLTAEDDEDSAVLRPDVTTNSAGDPGVAILSAAGRAELEARRAAILAGTTFNRNPIVDGENLQMQYQLAWSVGVAHELGAGMAITADYVANVGRDQMGRIDINEPINRVRPGVNVFDPNGVIIPAEARGTSLRRVLQFQTRKEFNGDYKSLQMSFVRRFANRWSMRSAYTLQRSHATGIGAGQARRVVDDYNPRTDFGRAAGSRTHVFGLGGTYNAWRGLTLGFNVSALSGGAINETVGSDVNGDNDNTDRPQAGVHDLAFPIVSKLDERGVAVINGITGPGRVETGLSIRYVFQLGGSRGLDLNFDIFNLTNRLNFNNPTGNRSSAAFNRSTGVGAPRQSQFGVRFRF